MPRSLRPLPDAAWTFGSHVLQIMYFHDPRTLAGVILPGLVNQSRESLMVVSYSDSGA